MSLDWDDSTIKKNLKNDYKWEDDFTWNKDKREYFDNFAWNTKENSEVLQTEYNENCDNENCDNGNCEYEMCQIDQCNFNDKCEYGKCDIVAKECLDNNKNWSKDEYYDGEEDNLISNQLSNPKQISHMLKKLNIESPMENLQETNISNNRYLEEVCIKPMRHILNQLTNTEISDIEIGTHNKETILNAKIVEVKDKLVKIQTPFDMIILPICRIVGIYTSYLQKVQILHEENSETWCDYECIENPLRKYFSDKIGTSFIIKTLADDELFYRVKGSITKVGGGVVILDNLRAISLPKIVSVEKNIKEISY